uniref:Paired amphipathic helix protein Sin3-like 2 isoform X1 n=1 Tax=Tanacetum cinerariifolium TaxID=118510 RepID=A0A6L2N0K2_TANCI|nr:paired amphipathic helix protein Sin3-like 2 isoform X1 [Tanacetum cinerariifolium]GEU79738.1 paired amphipathic helix protein Sin3-like 2 isoform X1 [Tanacetum cinerariifolium]
MRDIGVKLHIGGESDLIKGLVAKIKETKEKSQKNDDVLYSVVVRSRHFIVQHLEYDLIDKDIHEDLFKIIKYLCEEVCSTKEQMNQVLKLWTTFLEPMLYVLSRPENSDNVEDVEISTRGATRNEGKSDGSLRGDSFTFNNVKQGKQACNGDDNVSPKRVDSSKQGGTLSTPPVANGNFAKFKKEVGKLSPNVYFDKADLAAYGDHNGSDAKAKHSIEIDADADDEDIKNVPEGGNDVSRSESTDDECSREYHEDGDRNDLDGKAESK